MPSRVVEKIELFLNCCTLKQLLPCLKSYRGDSEGTRFLDAEAEKPLIYVWHTIFVNKICMWGSFLFSKDILFYVSFSFRPALLQCLRHISGYQKLVSEVTRLQKEKYSTAIDDHEQQLLKVKHSDDYIRFTWNVKYISHRKECFAVICYQFKMNIIDTFDHGDWIEKKFKKMFS